jgi:hypothetical protein
MAPPRPSSRAGRASPDGLRHLAERRERRRILADLAECLRSNPFLEAPRADCG